jgi:hypothetical protein
MRDVFPDNPGGRARATIAVTAGFPGVYLVGVFLRRAAASRSLPED